MLRMPALSALLLPGLFVFAVLGTAVGGAVSVELVFPAAALLLALRRAKRDPAGYIRLFLWTLMLSSGLRHFSDWYAGFSQSNPIMLTPYLVILAGSPNVLLYLLNRQRYSVEFLALIVTIAVGLGISLSTGAFSGPLMAAMRWLTPPWLALYIIARADALPMIRQAVHQTFWIALPATAIYGLWQFVSISPWDAYFMREAPINSIGFPAPFLVRVFATMNVPGSFAAMLSTGMLLLLPALRGWRWAGMLLSVAALLLTSQRAALGSLVAGILVVSLITRHRPTRARIGRLVISVAVVCAVLLSIPDFAKRLNAMAGSVTEISKNESAQVRWKEYEDLAPMLDAHKLGMGLGWSSNSLYITVGDGLAFDSGLIDIFVGLGILGGTVFLAALILLAIHGSRICRLSLDGGAAAEFGVVIYGFCELPFGSAHTQEIGMFFFLGFGLLLARGRTELSYDPALASKAAIKPSDYGRRRSLANPPRL